MSYKSLKIWRQLRKQELVDGMGGKCNRCGYDITNNALDFHHIDPKTKIETISNLLKNPTKSSIIYDEAEKCVLLCRNCHAEYHTGLWKLSDIKIFNFVRPKKIIVCKIVKCKICKKDFKQTYRNQLNCGNDCAGVSKRKVKRPTKAQLEKLVWKIPTTKIAKKYGVSDQAINKWCKSMGIEKPGRGYWSGK